MVLMQEIKTTGLNDATVPLKIIIEPELCKGIDCHICVHICPRKVLGPGYIYSKFGGTVPEPVDLTRCNHCRQCELHCPEMCISLEVVE